MDNWFVLWVLLGIAALSSAESSTSQAPTAGPVIPAYQQSGYIQHTSYPYSEGFESSPPYGSPDLQSSGPPSRSVVSTYIEDFYI